MVDALEDGLQFILDRVEETMDWRKEKATEYPSDARNLRAVEVAAELAADFPALKGTDLEKEFEGLWQSMDGDDGLAFAEWLSETTRTLGFHRFPDSAAEFVRDALERGKAIKASRSEFA